MKAEATHKS